MRKMREMMKYVKCVTTTHCLRDNKSVQRTEVFGEQKCSDEHFHSTRFSMIWYISFLLLFSVSLPAGRQVCGECLFFNPLILNSLIPQSVFILTKRPHSFLQGAASQSGALQDDLPQSVLIRKSGRSVSRYQIVFYQLLEEFLSLSVIRVNGQ